MGERPCVRVRVPASTSNLGAGFDCIGLALDRYLSVTYEPGPGPLRLERDGMPTPADALPSGAALAPLAPESPAIPRSSGGPQGDDEPQADDDLFTRAFRASLAHRGIVEPGGVLRAHSEIPVGRGLGSSAAAVVAGLALAAAVAGDELDRTVLLDQALPWEGHPDNAAPALFGGLVAVARDHERRSRPVALPLAEHVGFAFAAPGARVSTAQARSILPQRVDRDVATRSLGRIAALLRGLALADPTLIRIGLLDELHVPYRLALIPGAQAALDTAQEAGAWGATISGSGSGLIALCPPARAAAIAEAMAVVFRREESAEGAVSFAARPDRGGAQVDDGANPPDCRSAATT